MNKRNCITGILVLAFFILFYVYSLQLQPAAALWPKFICVTGMALSASNIVISGVKWQKERDQATVFPLNSGQIKRGIILAFIAALWIFAIPRVGFLSSSMLFTGITILIFEPVKDKKHIVRDIIATIFFSVFLFVMFSLLGIRFPRGILI